MDRDIRALLCDMAEGDMNAFAELYNMLSLRIFNYARTIAKNKEVAEDITHDVFLQINRQAARISEISDPAAYIMVITRNHTYNLIKRCNKLNISAVSLDSDDGFDISDNSSPYENILFEDAFSALPANQSETVYLHLICGYTLKDIAKMQDTPLVTVKWRYGRALSRLREYFAQDKQDNQGKNNKNNTKGENCNESY